MSRPSVLLGCALALAGALRAQAAGADAGDRDQGVVFRVVERRGDRVFVTAARAGVSAYIALKDLEALGAFRLNLELPGIRRKLEDEALSLFFKRKDAVSVAELVCVAAGLDLQEDRAEPEPGEAVGRRVLTVVTVPLPETSAGRQNLRRWALEWYDRYLQTLAADPDAPLSHESRVRIDMALLALAQGELLQAAGHFQAFLERAGDHPYADEARLKLAECWLEMGSLQEAIQESRKLLTTRSETEVGIEAALVFTKAHLALSDRRRREGRELEAAVGVGVDPSTQGLDDLVALLELYLSGFRNRDEFASLLLLLGEAHRRRGHPERVLEKIRQLGTVVEPIDLSDQDWGTLKFLSGQARVAQGDCEEGEKELLQYLTVLPADPRRGLAWLAMAHAEEALGDPLQALLCGRKALQDEQRLLPGEVREARVLVHKCLIALGRFDAGMYGLEVLLQEGPPDRALLVWTARTLLDSGRPERAKNLVQDHEDLGGAIGDQARLILVEAEARQKHHREVIEVAHRLAAKIVDASVQARVAELVGDAWTALGRDREAAEAYGGTVR
ncbi:MAG: tetratricopeptide repeat protein [Planctomycetota bacterium]